MKALKPRILSEIHESNDITYNIRKLSGPEATRGQVQASIQKITQHILEEVPADKNNLILSPILRAGLAMWPTASEFYDHPQTIFPEGTKDRVTNKSQVSVQKMMNLADNDIVVLDPIIATGKTVVDTIDLLARESPGSITVLSCYAALDGLALITSQKPEVQIVTGCLAEGVDEQGYLIPATNGDLGDKLYGKAETL